MSPSRFPRTILALLVAGAAIGPLCAAPPPSMPVEADATMQAAIEAAIGAVARLDDAAGARIESLEALAAGRRGDLLLQLAIALESSAGTERSMAGALLVRRLAFTPNEMIGTLAPRLDEVRPTLRRVMTELLGTLDRREAGAADFAPYAAWLRERRSAPPPALVRYLFETAPGEALRCLRGVYGGAAAASPEADAFSRIDSILARRDASRALGASEVDAGRAALDLLGRSPSWWDRRYAAAILESDPSLGSPALARRLEADPNPLVRDTRARRPGR